jgi:hypothetical protein
VFAVCRRRPPPTDFPPLVTKRRSFSIVLHKESPLDTSHVVLISSSLALLVLTLALLREVRLRRALQRLLARLLAHLRGKKP